MNVAVLGTALLAWAIPASGQIETTLQPMSPVIPANCQAALFSPGVPSAVVVLTVPAPRLPAGEVIGSPQLVAPRSRSTLVRPGVAGPTSSRPAGVIVGAGSVSGIGSMPNSGVGVMQNSGVGVMQNSGVGAMTRSGVGSMTSSGIGSIGMGTSGLGSIDTSSIAFPQSPPSPSPFAAPLTQSPAAGRPSRRANPSAQPLPGAPQRLPFFCP
jgi:hypothetical protein